MSQRARTTPRKLPRQSRSQATVDAILIATARVLVRDGYDRASTNRVALAAGVSVGSLYQYFPSKEALVASLIERHTDEMAEVIEAKLASLGDVPIAVAARETVAAMFHAHGINPKLHRVLIEQVPRVGRMGKIEEVERRVGVALRAYLESRKEQIRPRNVDLAVFVLVHSVEAPTHAWLRHDGATFDDAMLVDEVTSLVVRYIARGDVESVKPELRPSSSPHPRSAPRLCFPLSVFKLTVDGIFVCPHPAVVPSIDDRPSTARS